jgi:hypothetical protein
MDPLIPEPLRRLLPNNSHHSTFADPRKWSRNSHHETQPLGATAALHAMSLENTALSPNDRAEVEKFQSYIREIAAWERANDTLPDFAPIADTDRAAYEKRKLKATVEIYERIYGEKL